MTEAALVVLAVMYVLLVAGLAAMAFWVNKVAKAIDNIAARLQALERKSVVPEKRDPVKDFMNNCL